MMVKVTSSTTINQQSFSSGGGTKMFKTKPILSLWNCKAALLLLFLSLVAFNPSVFTAASPLRHLSTNLTSIYFIGDLHGDVNCAKEWVRQTNLVNLTSTPYTWKGSRSDAMVFLGDYVDKGSTSSSVLTFIRELQTTFSENVVSILGNHDFFQILDASLEYDVDYQNNPHPLGHPQHDYAYAFVHPEEYVESGYSPKREDDEEIMKALYVALEYVYDRHLEGDVRLCTSESCVVRHRDEDLFTTVHPFKDDPELSKKARERLRTWRVEYMNGLYNDGLLHWLIEQPVVAVVGDTLLAHGGVAQGIMNYVAKTAEKNGISVEEQLYHLVNKPFRSFFQTHMGSTDAKNQANTIKARLKEGYTFEIILNIVQHRGYFDPKKGCEEVDMVIGALQGENIQRICVGHTPRDYAEEFCGGKLLASDSSLSRSFRAYGNLYCPLDEKFVDDAKSYGSCSQNQFVDKCDGSISVLTRETADDEWPTNVKHLTIEQLKSRMGDIKDEL